MIRARGGIVAVIPGQAGIATFSPRLDDKGNSVRGLRVFEDLADQFGLHVFEVATGGDTLLSQFDAMR